MMDKDRIEGAAKTVGGKIKENVGALIGDAKMETEGKAKATEGRAQNAVGGIKDSVRDAVK
jgi:uncharacterized protein YjbJ (UPF0337 family)